MAATLTRDALNRALLARQLLLARSPLPAGEGIEHLVGLQAQLPDPPYTGLWSRLLSFRFEDLAVMVASGTAVRLAMMRGTIHLVTAEDAARLRPLLQPVLLRQFRSSPFAKALRGTDLDGVVSAAREELERQPLTFAELGQALARRWPGRDPSSLAQAARAHLYLVQTPPRGVWGKPGAARHTTLSSWLGPCHPVLEREPAEPAELVSRYLGAFGPASVADAQSWSGLTQLRAAFEGMDLMSFRDEDGTKLWDLPDAPRPGPGTPAPVRLLPPYDNILLAHADRRRIAGPVDLTQLFRAYRVVPGTVLVDGYVAGIWSFLRRPAVTIRAHPVGLEFSRSTQAMIVEEAERLLRAMGHEGDIEVKNL